jgi:DNA-binding CsgD family transcriptional regulator
MAGVFVGRADELQVLARVLEQGSSDGPAAAIVVGDPGSGKSRLLAEARSRAAGVDSFAVVGYEAEQHVPLAAASPLLRFLAATPDGRHLDDVLFRSVSPLEPVRVFEAAHRSFRKLEPVLLVVDDLHWVDHLTLGLCHYLVRAAAQDGGQRLTVFSASRPSGVGADLADVLPPDRLAVLELEPLSRDEGILLARSLDAGLDQPTAVRLWETAQGSPFWLEALVRTQTSAGDAGRLLAARLRGASADAASMLALLALAARPLALTDVAELEDWPLPRTEAATGELVARGVAVGAGNLVSLAHDLIRAAAANGLPEETKRPLQRRLAEWLEARAGGDVRLLREALEQRRAAAAPVLDLALRLAGSPRRTLLGGEGARQLADVADEAGPRDPRAVELSERVASLASEVGSHALALERWNLVAEQRTDPHGRGRALLEASKAAWDLERLADARSLLDQARGLAGTDLTLSLMLDAHEATLLLWGELRYVEGRELARRGAERAQRHARAIRGVDSLDVEARRAYRDALRAEYWAAMQLDRREDMLRAAEEATRAGRGLDERTHLESVLDAAFSMMILDRPREAEARARLAWEESRRHVLPSVTVRAGLSLAEVLVLLGRFDEASAVAAEAIELSARVDEVDHLNPRPVRVLDDIALHRGAWREALRHFERFADEKASAHSGIRYHARVAWWLARAGGETFEDDVVARLEQARADAEVTGCLRCSADLRLMGAEALAQVDRLEAARTLLDEWDASQQQSSFSRRRVGAIVAARRREPNAGPLLEAALAEAAERGLALDEIWTRLDLAEAFVGEDLGRAVEEFHVAAERAAAIGSRTQQQLAEQALRSLGVRTWRRSAVGTPLTKREQQVAQLVAGGATNREIAETLFLSPKTVERHVSNALRKVGARNRTELASRLSGGSAEYAGNAR